MMITGQDTDKKYTQLREALLESHKVQEYKQYLNDKSAHLTRNIPHAGFKFKFLHMHQLLDVTLDAIQVILRKQNIYPVFLSPLVSFFFLSRFSLSPPRLLLSTHTFSPSSSNRLSRDTSDCLRV